MATAADPRLDDDENTFLSWLSQRFQNCIRILKTDDVSEASLLHVLHDADFLEKQLNRVRGELVAEQHAEDFLSCVHDLITEGHELLNKAQAPDDNGYHAQDRRGSGRGAAKKDITKEDLQFFISLNMTAPRIAEALGVSESTIRRRICEFNLKLRQFKVLTDEELDAKVKESIKQNRRLGAVSVRARLRVDGINMQRQRVRDSMERVDRVGVALRALRPKLERTRYSVAGPNSLWHIDGNHKLIRYRIVIHGGIDGASRLVVFAVASPNNLASTVFKNFIEAAVKFGTPSRIRVDQGVENADICLFMELMRGLGRGSAIRGKSCHNQRIERLWVDIWNAVTNIYYTMFAFLESRQLIDPSSDVDISALHYVFIPRINADLQLFRGQWNIHGLSTENGRSPLELFAVGMLKNKNGNLTAVKDLFESGGVPRTVVSPTIGPAAGLAHVSGRTTVSVPQLENLLTQQQQAVINSSIDPLSPAEDDGMFLYLQTRDLIHQLLGMV